MAETERHKTFYAIPDFTARTQDVPQEEANDMRCIFLLIVFILTTSCQRYPEEEISTYISRNGRVAIDVSGDRFFYGPNMDRPPSQRLQDVVSSGDFEVGENCGFIGVSEVPLNLRRMDCKRFRFQVLTEGGTDIIFSYCLKPSEVCPVSNVSKPATKLVLNKKGNLESIEVAPASEYSAEYILTEGAGIQISK